MGALHHQKPEVSRYREQTGPERETKREEIRRMDETVSVESIRGPEVALIFVRMDIDILTTLMYSVKSLH
jgi:hypothetical protein